MTVVSYDNVGIDVFLDNSNPDWIRNISIIKYANGIDKSGVNWPALQKYGCEMPYTYVAGSVSIDLQDSNHVVKTKDGHDAQVSQPNTTGTVLDVFLTFMITDGKDRVDLHFAIKNEVVFDAFAGRSHPHVFEPKAIKHS